MIRIGLISDTHIPHRLAALPPAVFEKLAGVDLILHAGDVDDLKVLAQLGRIAPTLGVRGNIHFQALAPNDRALPLALPLEIHGHRLLLTHGHLSLWHSLTDKRYGIQSLLGWRVDDGTVNRRLIRRLARAFPQAEIIIFGHSHKPCVERVDHQLFVNPGAVCPTPWASPSVGILHLAPGQVEVELLPLDR
ncbi:MAG: metallophosphoesterase [Chloroflexi bacterium]|nr:MAG: metallophosphoesterase [Chloroflexota bacterium]